MHDVAHAAHRRERVAVGRAQRAQLGRQIVQRAAHRGRRRYAEREREPLVDRLDAALAVERHHAVAQVLQQVVEALAAQRFRVRRVRDLERGVHGGAHRRVRIDEHRAHPGVRREIGDEPRPDDGLDAALAHLEHARVRLLRALVRREHDVEPVRGRETAHLGRRLAVADERDPARIAPRPRERVHHVEAGRIDEHDGHAHARLQIGAVRAGGDDRVGALGARRRERRDRLLVAARDDPQIGAFFVFVGDVAKERAQPADADRPDARPHAGFG
ncbi:sigma54 specific transcriptional regulator, Fis family domain protein [Burkholderia mallei]|nr:sigma54 specific transcriptional regulator, Fis family domain protein [Burkholderia mallei]